MVARLEARVDWRFLMLAAHSLIVTAVGFWGVTEFSQYSPRLDANQQASPPVETANTNPWAGSSFPLENFTTYTSPFGYRRHPYGGYRFHYGLDFAAPMGSYIRNWWDGTVLRVAQDNACGTHAIIQSGQWTHVYCHMQGYVVVEKEGGRVLVDRAGGIALRQGTKIPAGEKIGRVGMTGSTTGPHLHWGLKYEGVWVDPAVVIKAMYESQ
jgi:murein DD-endopeptidase MepM/ murein hydrolase activator NlpD